MQIQINIIGESIDEIYQGILDFAAKIRPSGYAEAIPEPTPAKTTKRAKPAPVVVAPAPEPIDDPRENLVMAAPEPVAPDSPGQPNNGLLEVDPAKLFEEIKLLGTKIYNDPATRDKLDAVRKEFGFQKFAEIPEGQYAAVYARLKAIG